MSATSDSSRLDSGAQIPTDDVTVVSQTKVEVDSQSSDDSYTVTFGDDGNASCTCPDHAFRGTTCKHIFAACDELHIFDLQS